MDGLDDKLLAKILANVRRTTRSPRKDQLNLLRVCKKWYRVMDELVGIDAFLGRWDYAGWSANWTENHEPILIDSAEFLEKIGVVSLQVASFMNDSPVLPRLKRPALLRILEIKNFISPRSLESLLAGAVNLRKLKLSYSALYFLEFSDTSFDLPCEHLEVNGNDNFIHYHLMETGLERSQRTYEVLSTNILYLFRKSFPGLKRLTLHVRILEEILPTFMVELINLLKSHSKSLTDISVIMLGNAYGPHIKREYEPVPPQLEPLTIPDLQLENLRKITFYHFTSKSELEPEQSMSWMLRAKNLEELDLYVNYPQVLLTSIIANSEMTISKIRIQWIAPWKVYSFDCGILQNCTGLKYLMLYNSSSCNLVRLETQREVGLLNVPLLPKSITSLLLWYLPVTKEFCEIICLEFPLLEMLTLDFIPQLNEDGKYREEMSKELVDQIIERKQLKYFEVRIIIGGQYDGQSDGITDDRITGKLHENGKYTISVDGVDIEDWNAYKPRQE